MSDGNRAFEIPLTDAEVEQITSALAARVGARIRELRKMQGLTFDDLLNDFGIQRSWASRVENGVQNLTTKTAVKMAAVLGVRPWELFVPSEQSSLKPKRRRRKAPTDAQITKADKAFRKQIGARVKTLRALQGMSILTCADLAGVAEWTLEQLEAGRANIRASTAVRLADAIGVQPYELYLPTEQSGIRPSGKLEDPDG